MANFIDMTNKKINNFVVISQAEKRRQKCGKLTTYWKCQCKCGNIIEVRGDRLRNNEVTSCGCDNINKKGKYNGLSNSKIYTAWNHFINRCYNSNNKAYKNYGGRGIKVCDEWKNDFMSFYNWSIENGYREDLTIDRIDVNGNYEPSNCRWTTDFVQRRNRTDNHYVTINGETKILNDWAREFNIKPNAVRGRLKFGWDIIKALTEPVRRS